MSNTLWIFFAVTFLSNGDLHTLPMPTETYTADADATNSGAPAYSIRNLFPAQTGSQIRFHFSSGSCDPVPTPYRSQASHVSVGIQSGSGPNTVNTPVEVTTNGVSGYNMTPGGDGWSDWIDCPATVGQNILGIVSFTNAANTWGYKSSSDYGNWNSPTDGWNQAVMPGTISAQANRTHAIDRMQQR